MALSRILRFRPSGDPKRPAKHHFRFVYGYHENDGLARGLRHPSRFSEGILVGYVYLSEHQTIRRGAIFLEEIFLSVRLVAARAGTDSGQLKVLGRCHMRTAITGTPAFL
eukprot:1049609-Pleurochrysis_carterae.AAC.1